MQADVVRTGYDLVRARPLVVPTPRAWFPLVPGDRPLVLQGDAIVAGTLLAERYRDVGLEGVALERVDRVEAVPGRWLVGADPTKGRRRGPGGEVLYAVDDRLWLASGTGPHVVESPAAGIVREVRPGSGIALDVSGIGVPAAFALGGSARGRLVVGSGSEPDTRPASYDVSQAGAIVLTGGRVDAEGLTRARAMGLRGLIVTGLADRDERDFVASEARQRAGLHRLPPFAVLVLEGYVRRPLASPVRALLAAIAGREVAIVVDPPLLVVDVPLAVVPPPPPGWVRIRRAGGAREGTWIRPAGLRRLPGDVRVETGRVALDDGSEVEVPLGDLERFAWDPSIANP